MWPDEPEIPVLDGDVVLDHQCRTEEEIDQLIREELGD